jgi:hypothetical protein
MWSTNLRADLGDDRFPALALRLTQHCELRKRPSASIDEMRQESAKHFVAIFS